MGRNIRINGTDYEVTKNWNNQEVIRLRDQTLPSEAFEAVSE